eukprot:504596-Amorphochlora_amoeboformis.AAC.2
MSDSKSMRYNQRGVSADKEVSFAFRGREREGSRLDVHNAIKNVDKGLFPKAFCKVASLI